MGTWLAVFDQDGDVVASISKRPDHRPIEQILDEHGDEIFQDADSVVIEIDIDKGNCEEDLSLCREIRQKSIRSCIEYDHCNRKT